jgi:hypothetical protein
MIILQSGETIPAGAILTGALSDAEFRYLEPMATEKRWHALARLRRRSRRPDGKRKVARRSIILGARSTT